MRQLLEWIEEIRVFMEAGGDVLIAIFAVLLLMWVLILERFWYIRFMHPREARRVIDEWQGRADKSSWHAQQIRTMQVSEVSQKLKRSLTMIKTLVALCPLLGLLGTVTGMIEVFDVMAMVGSGNARAMASGVSMATIPTMAGMVAALSGLYFSARLDRSARAKTAQVAEALASPRC